MSRTGLGAGHGPSARRRRRRLEAESIKPQIKRYAAWRVQDAKARFKEVIRRARVEGPQRVTLRGEDAVVVIAVEDLNRLLPEEQPRRSLVDLLQSTALGEIDITRQPDYGRDIDL